MQLVCGTQVVHGGHFLLKDWRCISWTHHGRIMDILKIVQAHILLQP